MTINVNAPFTVSDDLQALIEDRVSKLSMFYERIQTADVFLKEEENRSNGSPKGNTVEIRLHVPGQILYADASSDSYERALPDTVDKMRRQVIRFKENLKP